MFLFCFCSQAYGKCRWCTTFSFALTLSDERFFFFFSFQGKEEKEESSGRLTVEALNTYLPTSLPTCSISGRRGDME